MKPEYFVYLSFIVFLLILYRAGVFKAAIDFLDESRIQIEREAEEAKAAFKKSESVYSEYKERMESLQKKADDILEDAKLSAAEMQKNTLKQIEELRVRYHEMTEKKQADMDKAARYECFGHAATQLKADLSEKLKIEKPQAAQSVSPRYLIGFEKSLETTRN